MKFTLSWLKEHLETDASLPDLTDKLTALGLEVEAVHDPAAELDAFKVAYVKSADPHPNADRLRVCIVDTGDGEVQVVCGAPNARTGMKGVFVPPGTHIPGTGLHLKKGVIRGVESNGMLVSEREVGLSDEHDGIIELAEDAPVGARFADIAGLSDPVIEIALTPDRGDCAGVRGIARDLAAAGMGTLNLLPDVTVAGAGASPIGVRFDFPAGAENACPLFAGRLIKGVRNGPSPKWLQDKLHAIGLRPISTLVDITNLFTMDRARPLHVFDADKVQGDLVLRLSQTGQSIDALNDKSYTLGNDRICVICDDTGVVSLGGIVGGTSTGCTEETTNVFLEAALFDPMRTAETGRALGIESDARYRFERGVDPEHVVPGIEAATALIIELCGGEASETVVTGAIPDWRRTLHLRPSRAAELGGLNISVDRQKAHLSAFGFTASDGSDGRLVVVPPSWRPDVEGEADLVEEVLRVEGFDNIPAISLKKSSAITRPAVSHGFKSAGMVKRALAGNGLSETVTWSFMASGVAAQFGFHHDGLRLLNPIASDLDVMRPSILPNLIQAAGRNASRGLADNALFEVGPVYRDPSSQGQLRVASGVRSGLAAHRHWSSGHGRNADAYDAKADALTALTAAGAPAANLQTTTDAPDWFHPGRSGVLRLGANVLAQFGEIHPAVLESMDVEGPVAAFEVFLDSVPAPRRKSGTERPLLKASAFQPVARDFAFLVDADRPADTVLRAAKAADRKLIASVDLFDVYQGKGVPDGQKSLAVTVTLQPMEATLTNEQIDAIAAKIVAQVEKQTGAVLRG